MFQHSVRKPHGIIIVADDTGTWQRDTLSCCHCGVHWEHKPGSGIERGFCQGCSGPTCGAAKCREHIHKTKKLDLYERGLITEL